VLYIIHKHYHKHSTLPILHMVNVFLRFLSHVSIDPRY